jgi:hypothetical protein
MSDDKKPLHSKAPLFFGFDPAGEDATPYIYQPVYREGQTIRFYGVGAIEEGVYKITRVDDCAVIDQDGTVIEEWQQLELQRPRGLPHGRHELDEGEDEGSC